jgi:hypothetical protein
MFNIKPARMRGHFLGFCFAGKAGKAKKTRKAAFRKKFAT